MRKLLIIFALFVVSIPLCLAQSMNEALPVRGFAIEAPRHDGLDSFIRFINNELAPSNVNLLILRVDWGYEYKTHPELSTENALTRRDVRKLVRVCKKNKIRLVPHINLLGHQSVRERPSQLLKNYPQFDENPSFDLANIINWPLPQKNYSKSYCPLHPDVHKVVFDIVDEICKVFKADIFHAGMDEVFFLGEDECPRCNGKDKAELFAGEVKAIHDHLASKGRHMMIWGDRLLDGRTTGLGGWEASLIGTSQAIDMIPKDIIICDWHYEKSGKTAVYFAQKGFQVTTCGYKNADVSIQQIEDMIRFRSQVLPATAQNLQGYIQTIWNSPRYFLERYYGDENNLADPDKKEIGVKSTRAVLKYFRESNKGNNHVR